MSIATVYTNKPLAHVPREFQGALTSLVQKGVEASREVVVVRVCSEENMTMGGNFHPCVFATLETSAKLSPAKCVEVLSQLENFLHSKLQVPTNRILIRLIPVEAHLSSYSSQQHHLNIVGS
ncbi:macrophage migration inhibitory factor homolog [Haliotis cracherodii]|uniref:macrophage migration inhibitory factor homolog n=1 Tax=Haliotis cracherodii TaxID=6455 RepID=UPI0039EA7B02